MPYIGAKELKASDIRRFDVTSSTSATHTLTWTPPTEQSLIVTINGIKQHEDAYSVSGTTLTLSSALVATDKLEVIGINDIGTTITPAQNSVDTDKIANNAVTAAKLNTTGTASASTFLRGDMAWATPTDQGKVLQVVQTVKSDTFSSSSSSWTDITGLSVSITPSSASSKILIMYSIIASESASQFASFRITRNSTGIAIGDASGNREPATTSSWGGGANNYLNSQSVQYLDSPSTTSSTTYKVQTISTASQINYINRNVRDNDAYYEPRTISTITVMEIAG